MSERRVAFTAASNSSDEVRFSPRLRAKNFEKKDDTVVLFINYRCKHNGSSKIITERFLQFVIEKAYLCKNLRK